MAPVSKYVNPSSLANRFANVLFPAPDGPSIATITPFIPNDILSSSSRALRASWFDSAQQQEKYPLFRLLLRAP
jgi:hypothetical protein